MNFFTPKRIVILIMAFIFICLKFIQTNDINKIIKNEENLIVNTKKIPCKVVRVIDGDTIEVVILKNKPENLNTNEIIRLIGVNTPELNTTNSKEKEYFAEEAYQFTKKELNNKYIEIQIDNISSERDKYGRLIAYVWINEFLFNQLLIEQGYGLYYDDFKFNTKKMKIFELAQNYAKINNLGLWQGE